MTDQNWDVGDIVKLNGLLVRELEDGDELHLTGRYKIIEHNPAEPAMYAWTEYSTLEALEVLPGQDDPLIYEIDTADLWEHVAPESFYKHTREEQDAYLEDLREREWEEAEIEAYYERQEEVYGDGDE